MSQIAITFVKGIHKDWVNFFALFIFLPDPHPQRGAGFRAKSKKVFDDLLE
jgi:hypothetical protein